MRSIAIPVMTTLETITILTIGPGVSVRWRILLSPESQRTGRIMVENVMNISAAMPTPLAWLVLKICSRAMITAKPTIRTVIRFAATVPTKVITSSLMSSVEAAGKNDLLFLVGCISSPIAGRLPLSAITLGSVAVQFRQ